MHKLEIRKIIFFSITLMVIILGIYVQVGKHQFINLDDPGYVTDNPFIADGLSVKNIVWAFTSIDCFYWQPLTWLSHMVDVQIYGMNPSGHHLTSVAIHMVSSLFVLFFFFRLTGGFWQSLFVAFLFALHPQSVESVAWVAERKDVLSALFWFLTLIIYVEFVRKRKLILYVLCLCSFILGLMAKPMVVTLPLVLLLLDFWPLGRFSCNMQMVPLLKRIDQIRPIFIEKVPFFVCSFLSVLVTIYGHNQAGGLRGLNEMSVLLRIENALVSYVAYIGKALLPLDLAVLYPFPATIPLWQVIGSLLLLLVFSMIVIRVRHTHPYCVTGWFWFLFTLSPVIGLLQTGPQAMADRFSYVAKIGLFIIATWGVPELTKNFRNRNGILALAAGAIVFLLTLLTWNQIGYWRDNVSLYRRTLNVTTDNVMIHNNLGLAMAEQGDLQAAMQEYREAIRIEPGNFTSHSNLGLALATQGSVDAAITEYHEALRLNPNFAKARINLGIAFVSKGEIDAAISEYLSAISISSGNADAYYNLGLAYARKGAFDDAVSAYQKALLITPNDLDTHLNLGTAYAGQGQLDLAILKFQEILQVRPDNRKALNNLQIAVVQKRIQESSGSVHKTQQRIR